MRLVRYAPFALPFLLACGGSSPKSEAPQAPAVQPMSVEEARAATWGFLTAEHSAAVASKMPGFIPAGGGYLLSLPPIPPCVGVAVSLNAGLTTVALTFRACAGPAGGTLNGGVTITFNAQATDFSIAYQNLVAKKDMRTWTFNGAKSLKVDVTAKQATLVANHLSATFTDSAHPEMNRAYLYDATLHADWATVGIYKLSGTFSLTDGANTTSGTIPSATPLTWTDACCYPVGGAITFMKNGAATNAAFGLPCGTLTITPAGQAPQTQLLAACPQ